VRPGRWRPGRRHRESLAPLIESVSEREPLRTRQNAGMFGGHLGLDGATTDRAPATEAGYGEH